MRNLSTLKDSELLQEAQQGDTAAFEELVYRHDKHVLSIAARYVDHADDAKDIYQEVFLRVYRGMQNFRFRSEFTTWLYRITTNVCLTYAERRKKHVRADGPRGENSGDDAGPLPAGVTAPVTPERQTISLEISDRVQAALETLSPQQRLVFTLRHYEGYKLREIAGMMKCTDGTVKKYLFTATRRLREELKDLNE